MVNNDLSEDMVGAPGAEITAEYAEANSGISSFQPDGLKTPSPTPCNDLQIDLTVMGDEDENTRLSPTSLYCSVPLNRDVQSIIDNFSKTEAEKVGKKTRKLPCLYCDRTFVADNLRQKHIERCHSIKQARRSSSRFQQSASATPCLFCDKFIATEQVLDDLFQHLVKEHSNKYFGCLICKERFTLLAQLEEHNEESHGIKREVKVQSIEDLNEVNSAIIDNSVVVKTRHKTKIKDEVESSDDLKNNIRKGRILNQKELKGNKRIAIKSTKLGIKRSTRLQSKVIQPKQKRKPKLKEKPIEEKVEKDIKPTPNENPYPTFDAFYRVKKITDHSIDNLRISSLTFDDVFDQAFFTRIKCNIRENLLNHIDGKLFKNEESESRISNFEKTQPEVANTENYGCEISLNAATPVPSLLTTQFGEDIESQIEYGSKASKKKTTPKKDEVHYKYFTRRKYQASILESKENRDLSKLDMWTQYIIKDRQQTILNTTKSDKEKQDYKKGEEYKAKVQNEELNRILDRRGPFEDLKEEANKKAALEGTFNQEANSDVSFVLEEILGNVFGSIVDTVEVKTELTDAEIPSYLNLRIATTENDVDKSDKITLICSSQETENFEEPEILPRDKNALVELTGEWARSRLYICAACGLKFATIKLLIDHKNFVHQNVWCQHYEFVGNQGKFYKHLSIPGLGKMGYLEENSLHKIWKRSEARTCTKCKKTCNTLGELHRHVLECGEDWSWMLVRKKCKYKPFGAKTRRKRRGLFKRIINKEKATNENGEKKKIYKKVEGPRVKPSDAETIQRMLANLPAKRATRKIMCLKDGFPKAKKIATAKKNDSKKTSNIKTTNLKMRRTRTELLLKETDKIVKRKIKQQTTGKKSCNPVNNIRKSVRNLNKVISSKLIDNSGALLVKRKIKSAMQQQRFTRSGGLQQEAEKEVVEEKTQEEEEETQVEKDVNTTKNAIIKKVQSIRRSVMKKRNKQVKKGVLEEIKKVEESTIVEDETVKPDVVEDKQELKSEELASPIKKKVCKKENIGLKIIRSLSLKKKNKESSEEAEITQDKWENVVEGALEPSSNVKRKSKFDTLRNVVKKMKFAKKTTPTPIQSDKITQPEVEPEPVANIISGHFLEEKLDSNIKTCKEDFSDKINSDNVLTVETINLDEELPPKILEHNLECEPESETVNHVDNGDVCDNLIVNKSEVIEPSKSKGKLAKRPKGLNACIAMLTSKLQQKDVVDDKTVGISLSSESLVSAEAVKTKDVFSISNILRGQDEIHKPKVEQPSLEKIPSIADEVFKNTEPVELEQAKLENTAAVKSNNEDILHTNLELPVIVRDKENIESISKESEYKEISLEKVVDIIKHIENINHKENINGNSDVNEDVKNGINKSHKKQVARIGSVRRRQQKKEEESKLNEALIVQDDFVATENSVRKIGQNRIVPKRNKNVVKEIEKSSTKKKLSIVTEESFKDVDVGKLEEKVAPVVVDLIPKRFVHNDLNSEEKQILEKKELKVESKLFNWKMIPLIQKEVKSQLIIPQSKPESFQSSLGKGLLDFKPTFPNVANGDQNKSKPQTFSYLGLNGYKFDYQTQNFLSFGNSFNKRIEFDSKILQPPKFSPELNIPKIINTKPKETLTQEKVYQEPKKYEELKVPKIHISLSNSTPKVSTVPFTDKKISKNYVAETIENVIKLSSEATTRKENEVGKARDLEKKKAKELEKKKAKEMEEEFTRELEIIEAKKLEEEVAKELEKRKAKELQIKMAKDLEEQKAKELEDKIAKELEKQKEMEEKIKLEKKKAKEMEEEMARELEIKRVKEIEKAKESEVQKAVVVERQIIEEIEEQKAKEREVENAREITQRQKVIEEEKMKEIEREKLQQIQKTSFINGSLETNLDEVSFSQNIKQTHDNIDIRSKLEIECEPDILENKSLFEPLLNVGNIGNESSDSEDELPLAILAKSSKLGGNENINLEREGNVLKENIECDIIDKVLIVGNACGDDNKVNGNIDEVVGNVVKNIEVHSAASTLGLKLPKKVKYKRGRVVKKRTKKELPEDLEILEYIVENQKEIPKEDVYNFIESPAEQEDVINHIVSDNSKENIEDQESPKRTKKKQIKKIKPQIQQELQEMPQAQETFTTPLKDNKNTETNNESFIQTPDLNDSLLNNKLTTKLKMKQGKGRKTKTIKKKEPPEEMDSFCDICNKKFMRNDSLVKHKRTLTHIAKLSEIEAREAEEKARLRELESLESEEKSEEKSDVVVVEADIVDENTDEIDNADKEEVTKDGDQEVCEVKISEDIVCEDVFEDKEGSSTEVVCDLITSPFSLKTNTDTLKLADIINDVLNKPTENVESFSDILDQKQEIKRYKSLGERKSFDSDTIYTNTNKPSFTNHINQFQNGNNTDAFLEKQISILENMIENKSSFQYIDEISVSSNKSEQRCPSDMSLVSDIKPDDSNIISFSHNTNIVNSLMHSDANFVKPTQYEEISEDTRNFDDQRARKALNRDEELFLECCSLLKSSSEVSNYSKKSARAISIGNNYDLKTDEEPEWLERKSFSPAKINFQRNSPEFLSENSCPNTPIGDNYDDFSNSNTIKTDWNTKMKEREFEDISLDSISNSNQSNFKNFNINFNEEKSLSASQFSNKSEVSAHFEPIGDSCPQQNEVKFAGITVESSKDLCTESEEKKKKISKRKPTEVTQTSITDYVVPISKKIDNCNDSLTNDSKKMLTKGAMKVFEGLKVSIPTEELDMNEVLNCSPTSKRLELKSTEINDEILPKPKNSLKKFGNKLGLKVTKKRAKPRAQQHHLVREEDKIHDIYDFEETQDNTDLFIPNNLSTFRKQLTGVKDPEEYQEEKEVTDEHNKAESDIELSKIGSDIEENKIESDIDDAKELDSDTESNHQYVDTFNYEAQSVSSFSTETESSVSVKKPPGVNNMTKKKCVIMGRIFKNAFKPKIDEIKDVEESKVVENYVNCPPAPPKPRLTEEEMDLLFDKLLEENKAQKKAEQVKNNLEPSVKEIEMLNNKMVKGKCKNGKTKKRSRKVSESSDDEFNLSRTPKKRSARKKVKDNGINLEQELKECMGVAGRKSQRKCTSGKQNVLVEVWSSDDSEFEAMMKQTLQMSKQTEPEAAKEVKIKEIKVKEVVVPEEVKVAEESTIVELQTEEKTVDEINPDFLKEIVKDVAEGKRQRRKSNAKPKTERKERSMKPENIENTLAANRRKRAAADTLYYWSSSSDDESHNLIEIKSVREDNEEDEDRPMQHGWIVGDSPKKLVTMLAQAKGKKLDVKEQSKKRSTI